MVDKREITGLLKDWSAGRDNALEQLTPIVYAELHEIAQRIFSRESGERTLQPTALVHEVFLRLVDAQVSWKSRAHFFALSSRMMRRILVDHAHARKAKKRGGNAIKVTLQESLLPGSDADTEILALDEALQQFAAIDADKADLLVMQYFAGLTFREMEEVTGKSSSTLDRELRFARAWLRDRLTRF